MYAGLNFEEFWPGWPGDTKGRPLVDVHIKRKIDDLAVLLWSPDSPFIVELILSIPEAINIPAARPRPTRKDILQLPLY